MSLGEWTRILHLKQLLPTPLKLARVQELAVHKCGDTRKVFVLRTRNVAEMRMTYGNLTSNCS